MIQIDLGYPRGKFADICADPLGWAVVLQDETDGHLRLVQLTPAGERRVPDVTIRANGGNAFPVLTHQAGATWLAWRDNTDGFGLLKNLTTGSGYELGVVHGNNPIAFGIPPWLGMGLCAFQSSGGYQIGCFTLATTERRSTSLLGRPTGLAYVAGDFVPVLVDDLRLSQPGMVNPRYAGGCFVGENAAGQNRNIARLEADGRVCNLWSGLDSFTPRIAHDGERWAVVTWGWPGVRLAILEDTDFEDETVDPPPPPDIPWTTNPTGVVEDIAPWLFSPNQGPDVHLSPDGTIRFFCKSDELSGDGPHPEIGEHWDIDVRYIGHLEDASTGRRILDGKEVIAEDIVRRFPDTHAQVWAGLKLNRNTFADGRRLWLPRRCVSGTRIRYVTDITWTVPPRETPHTRVWQNIPIEIRVDVGYARIHGQEVFVRGAYIPDGHPEVNYFGPPAGFNAWVAGPFGTFDSEWMRT